MFPSISSIFFSARSIWLWVFFHFLFCFWAGWVVVALNSYSTGSGHLTYPWNNFFPGGNPTEWHSTWLFPGSGPNMSQPFMFPSISSIFFSARSIWLWLFFSWCVLFLCWLGGCGSYFFIQRFPGHSCHNHPTSTETGQNMKKQSQPNVLSCFCAGWVVVAARFLFEGSGHLTYP